MTHYLVRAREVVYYSSYVEADNKEMAEEIFNDKPVEEFIAMVDDTENYEILEVIESD
jgi:hypothetical protein